ncbi:iron complex outermembrane receptor protein [Nitrospirillum amazonense]|uniref:Iron complex outermembrane receptor protein n=1 Tax=Nitrospirillum amazonense TaxID=28077 RepID=A0A560FP72_9PROT|nr:TonB-dependent receptor [Nitrospirillum amazonense]TWB23405.1 iron complex outermembrane receptor protein [Nitrospirillum amazonense]
MYRFDHKTSGAVALTAALALSVTWARPAQAQATQSAEAPPNAGTASSWTSINEIIVTGLRQSYTGPNSDSATRTDTPLIEIPQSVQVLTRSLITEQDRRTLGDALINVSGVVPTRSEELLLIPPLVRGFPAEVYLDGLPIYAGNQQAFDPDSLVGVERIDVLKGPSATLYGGGLGTPLGGVINIESERPNDKLGGYVAMRAGSFSTWNPYGDINVPLAPGVAARVAAEYQSNDSWIDKVHGKHWSVQPSLSIQMGPSTDLLLQGQFNNRSQLEYSGLPAEQALAGQIDRNAFPGSPNGQPLTTNNNRMGQATLHHNFTDDMKLTVTGRYYDSSIREYGSFIDLYMFPSDPATPTVYPIIPITMITDTKEGTLDANLQAKVNMLGGSHTFLAGVDYDWTRFASAMGLFVSNTPDGTIDLAHPVYDATYTPQLPPNYPQVDNYRTVAGYVQDQATYDRLHITGALRYTRLEFREVSSANVGVNNDATYGHVSPRIGATFDVAPGVALFAGYATAFRAAFGFIGLTAPKPETSRNLEAGLKVALPGTGLSGTISVFDQTHDNVATSDPNNLGFSIQTGRQRARGAEVDLIWEPTPAFSLLANYAYTDAKVTADNSIPVGSLLTRVPKNSGRIAARYRLLDGPAKGLSFGAGLTALSERQLTIPNTVSVPGYAVIDAQAAYDFQRFTIQVSAVNLGGRRAFDTYQYFTNPLVMPIQPRSAYVTLIAKF